MTHQGMMSLHRALVHALEISTGMVVCDATWRISLLAVSISIITCFCVLNMYPILILVHVIRFILSVNVCTQPHMQPAAFFLSLANYGTVESGVPQCILLQASWLQCDSCQLLLRFPLLSLPQPQPCLHRCCRACVQKHRNLLACRNMSSVLEIGYKDECDSDENMSTSKCGCIDTKYDICAARDCGRELSDNQIVFDHTAAKGLSELMVSCIGRKTCVSVDSSRFITIVLM